MWFVRFAMGTTMMYCGVNYAQHGHRSMLIATILLAWAQLDLRLQMGEGERK